MVGTDTLHGHQFAFLHVPITHRVKYSLAQNV